jgi:hypothetical protein
MKIWAESILNRLVANVSQFCPLITSSQTEVWYFLLALPDIWPLANCETFASHGQALRYDIWPLANWEAFAPHDQALRSMYSVRTTGGIHTTQPSTQPAGIPNLSKLSSRHHLYEYTSLLRRNPFIGAIKILLATNTVPESFPVWCPVILFDHSPTRLYSF